MKFSDGLWRSVVVHGWRHDGDQWYALLEWDGAASWRLYDVRYIRPELVRRFVFFLGAGQGEVCVRLPAVFAGLAVDRFGMEAAWPIVAARPAIVVEVGQIGGEQDGVPTLEPALRVPFVFESAVDGLLADAAAGHRAEAISGMAIVILAEQLVSEVEGTVEGEAGAVVVGDRHA